MNLADMIGSLPGAAGNAGRIVELRKKYNDYVAQGGELSFEEFAREHGVNPNPYQNKK